MRVAYLGPRGTFSEEAACQWMKGMKLSGELIPCTLIPEVFLMVEENEADVGVVPVENSIEGTVGLSLDYLNKTPDLYIVGEVVLPIRHCIAVNHRIKDKNFTEIKYIYSHSQALGQCREYLKINFPGCELRQASSTAEAASIVASGMEKAAAICSPFAAEKYSLEVIASDIQDYPNNKTRFFVLENEPLKFLTVEEPGKTSMVFSLPEDSPGSLYMVLKYFAEEKINLMKIESRPAKKELGHYFFYLDCEGYVWEEPLASVIERLEGKTVFLKILGSYPRAS
ncbi:MAG: prephenate dehydratase [Clostridia bacterium]|nr:prephenate dehydratase [Clostridia bacterium]